MLPQQYCLRWKYHHSNLQTMFSQLLDRGCFCDVTLACEGQMIRAHRVVLCACSTFFDTVLTNYASERDPIIIMKDVTFADVKCLIEFMYKGEINVEHAHLASLLKTADDLKIKGLAEVSWREDDDGAPLPLATEFQAQDSYVLEPPPQLQPQPTPQQQQHHHHHHQQQQQQQLQHMPHLQRVTHGDEQRRRSLSPAVAAAMTQPRLPTLTPIPTAHCGTSAASPEPIAHHYTQHSHNQHLLGPKRKRGRPPLDDAYDVFNVRKLAHYAGHLEHQAYLDSRHYHHAEEQPQAPLARTATPPPTASTSAAAAAYQHHIHQQQSKQRMRQQRQQQQQQLDDDAISNGAAHADPEWITSNLEVNMAECGEPAAATAKNTGGNNDLDTDIKEHERTKPLEREERVLPPKKLDKRKRERSPEPRNERSTQRSARKSCNERNAAADEEHIVSTAQAQSAQLTVDDVDVAEDMRRQDDAQQGPASTVPQTVEDMENAQPMLEERLPVGGMTSTATPSSTSTSSSASSSSSGSASTASGGNTSSAISVTSTAASLSAAAKAGGAHHTTAHSPQPQPPPAALHHAHFAKYAPDGYLLNEHGMLMTHDFVHAPTASIPVATASSAGAPSNGNEQEFVDIKIEDFEAADMRLTSEEMSQWQDVIKMDDYLAKGRRPQFWEEPFTRRVLDAIKNKRLEMKKAARILGVSYGTLYGRYREVYGCLKHPYNFSSTSLRSSQSSQLTTAAPVRFDMVWPLPKRDTTLVPGQFEIGKIRPKDLSELWIRPQM